ncbi:F-box only protein 22-like isoform X1 [Vespula maculifrons]|uniref:F-box only protein 22-like isoform X1 n=1 Tax=Vespula maculifrons TaxID=7453 RepID=A0ABD2D131_VESMC
MEQNINYYVLRSIFEYLNGLDLSNASQVCKSWLEVAEDEKRRRGPSSVIRNRKEMKSYKNWDDIKKEMIECFAIKPALCMFSTNSAKKDSHLQRCHCKYLPYNCYTVSLDMENSLLGNENLVAMYFPKIPNIQISTFTFNMHPWTMGIYCEELKTLFDNSLNNAEQLKTVIEASFDNDCHNTSCWILLCKIYYGTSIGFDLLEHFYKWFPRKRVSICGGIVNDLSVCNSVHNSRVCKNMAECVAILISGTKMQIWTVSLDEMNDNNKDIEDKLKNIKEIVKLKKHSIIFMFISEYCSSDMDNLELIMFEYFPRVPVVKYFCNGAFAGENLNEKYIQGCNDFENINTSVLMILTYD